jgi:hypothetical protein
MCRICGNPTCGEYSTLSAAAAPVSAAVAVLKAAGFRAIGIALDEGVPPMAHDALTAREVLDRREAAQKNLKAAHERQHGVAKANENLAAPDAVEQVETDADGNVTKARTKAQKPAEDK